MRSEVARPRLRLSRTQRSGAGLAESLRNELILYGISVHLFLPATIYSPGFEREQLLKPEITKKVEGPDEGMSCEGVAKELIKGPSDPASPPLTSQDWSATTFISRTSPWETCSATRAGSRRVTTFFSTRYGVSRGLYVLPRTCPR